MSMPMWSLSPIAVVAIVLWVAYEVGVRRGPRSRGASARAWSMRVATLLVVAATATPLAAYGMQRLSIHMINHLLLMFFAPAAYVLSGPVLPVARAIGPFGTRRLARALRESAVGQTVRALGRWLTQPIVAFLLLNVTMVTWHIPRFFDAAMSRPFVHDYLMTPSFLIVGVLFWLSILPCYPWPPKARLRTQLLMVVGTNLEMLLLAMALSVFTSHAWYSGADMFSGDFADQQVAAGILWICGDFWALPTVILIARRLIARDGSLMAALDRAAPGQADDEPVESSVSASATLRT
jgi:putative membrane protein